MAVFAFGLLLLLGWFLTVLPIPSDYAAFWPLWLPSLVLAWLLVQPMRWGVVVAWFAGLSLDLLTGTPLTAQALGLAAAAYVATLIRIRFFHVPLSTQFVAVGVLLFVFQTIQIGLRIVLGAQIDWALVYAALPATLVLWPLMYWVVARLRQRLVN